MHGNFELFVVDQRPAFGTALLGTLDIEEPVWPEKGALMPGLRAQRPHVGAVLKQALVEFFAGELADLRVHTILHVEQVHVLSVVLLHPDEQTLVVAVSRGGLRQDRRGQLLGISHENALGAAVLEWDEGAQLHALGGLINDDRLKLDVEVLEHLMAAAAECGAQDLGLVENVLLDLPTLDFRLTSECIPATFVGVNLCANVSLPTLQLVEFALQLHGKGAVVACSSRLELRPQLRNLLLELAGVLVKLFAIARAAVVGFGTHPSLDQLVESDIFDRSVDRITAAQTHDVDFVGCPVHGFDAGLQPQHQFVHGGVAGSADQQLFRRHLWSMGCRTPRPSKRHRTAVRRLEDPGQEAADHGDNRLGFSRSRRALDQGETVIFPGIQDGTCLAAVELVILHHSVDCLVAKAQHRRRLRLQDFVHQIIVLQALQCRVLTFNGRHVGDFDDLEL